VWPHRNGEPRKPSGLPLREVWPHGERRHQCSTEHFGRWTSGYWTPEETRSSTSNRSLKACVLESPFIQGGEDVKCGLFGTITIRTHNGDVTAPTRNGSTDSAWLFNQLNTTTTISATASVLTSLRGRAPSGMGARPRPILVARSADTQAWDRPGGPLRVCEDVCTAVHRVVADSVALGVSVGWMAGIHSHVRDGVTLIFLARHVSGRAAAKGDVQLCRWVTPDVAVRMLWPRRAEQLRGALRAQQPQPVVVYGLPKPAWAIPGQRYPPLADPLAGV
jgi:hypothetical protein